MDDVHCAGRAEHRDLGGGPREVQVRADGFGSHHDVRAAERLAQHHGHHRHLRVGVGVDHLGAAADDAGVLLVGAGLVAGHVHEGDHGQVERVAQSHESGDLLGRVDVQDAGEHVRLVRHDADRLAVDAGEADERGGAEQFLHLHEFAVIDDATDHFEHVVGLPFVGGHDGGEPLGGFAFGAGGGVGVDRRLAFAVGRQVGEHGARVVDGIRFVLAEVVGHAGHPVMHFAAAEVGHGDGLAGRGLDHVRSGDEHVRVLAGHDDEVRQCRAIDGATGAGAEDQAQLGHEAAGLAGLAEDAAVLGQGGHTFLDAGATGVHDGHDRHFEVDGHVHQSADLLAFGGAEGTALDGEVLGVDGDFAAVDLAEAGDDGRTGVAAGDVAALEATDLLKRASVEEQVKAFARGFLAFGVLFVAGALFGGASQFGGLDHGGAQRLVSRRLGGVGRRGSSHGIDGRRIHNVSHCRPPSWSPRPWPHPA